MKRFFLLSLLLLLSGLITAHAADSVQAAQTKLRAEGYYFGDPSGVYDSATAAAVTRYQIRNGLTITGKLDAETAKALSLSAPAAEATSAKMDSETWRRLRKSDEQFLQRLNSGAVPPPGAAASSPAPTRGPVAAPRPPSVAQAQIDPHAPPPPIEEGTPPPAARRLPPSHSGRVPDYAASPERLRDYVAAFVLAGLDPQVGAELEFFGEKVNYFGEPGTSREKIRQDLLRYDRRWPQRRFVLAGDLQIERLPGRLLRVTFPLRYELRSRSEHSSGKVMKTITLRKVGQDDFEIVAVDEKKAG